MQWTLLKSPDFKVDNGWWKVVSTGPQSCEVTYGLEIEFNFWVPGPVFKSLIGAALPTMLREYEEYAKTL
jgi:ribosome-associated toxin RatA of RatAB toxin-antitoxin module